MSKRNISFRISYQLAGNTNSTSTNHTFTVEDFTGTVDDYESLRASFRKSRDLPADTGVVFDALVSNVKAKEPTTWLGEVFDVASRWLFITLILYFTLKWLLLMFKDTEAVIIVAVLASVFCAISYCVDKLYFNCKRERYLKRFADWIASKSLKKETSTGSNNVTIQGNNNSVSTVVVDKEDKPQQ